MNNIEKYIDIALMGIVVIIAIPALLFLLPFTLAGYIICKIFKINVDKLRYFDYFDYDE